MSNFPPAPVLILGGSAEARALAYRMARVSKVILSGPERVEQNWPVPVLSGFLKSDTFGDQLDGGVRVLVDASHPADQRSSEIAVFAAADRKIPLLRLTRPEWRATRRDRWRNLRLDTEVARVVGRGKRLLLATGRETLRNFMNLRECYVFSRQISDHTAVFPLPRGRFLSGQAPFSVAEEMALMRRLGIDWLVLRNAGGAGGWPKLEAARRLGVQVAMLSRPVLPKAPTVCSVDEAEKRILSWLS